MTTFLFFVITVAVMVQVGRQIERKFGPRQLRHKHSWEIVEQKELPSPSEIAKQTPTAIATEIKRINHAGYSPNTNTIERLTRREVIVHRRCSLCGEEEVVRV